MAASLSAAIGAEGGAAWIGAGEGAGPVTEAQLDERLAIMLAGCLAFALSPRIYVGHFLVLDIPYPAALDGLFTMFRSLFRISARTVANLG